MNAYVTVMKLLILSSSIYSTRIFILNSTNMSVITFDIIP